MKLKLPEKKKNNSRQNNNISRMISVFGSSTGQEELDEIRSCIDAQWLGIGPKTKLFEAEFSKRLGGRGFKLVNSGSNSLYIAVKLLNLPAGTEIILPSFTWIACAHAVVLAGCTPVFCDVDLDTQNVTDLTIASCITKKTGAIMVVHYAGKPVDMKPILKLGYPVIEDAAHAVDSKFNGQYCGTMGKVGIYSFDAVKNLVMGEGGGITAQDPELVKRASLLRYCGIGKSGFEASEKNDRWWEYNIVDFVPKFISNDLSAAVGLVQLRKLGDLQTRRKQIWDLYQREFEKISWLKRPVDGGKNEQHSYFTYFVRLINGKRDAFAKYLRENGIYSTLRFHPLHLNPIYKSNSRLPSTELLNEQGLNIPLHPGLSDSEIEHIIQTIKSFA
jgi:aminotransferase